MAPERTRPKFDDDERTQLLEWLRLQRAVIHWKCDGLSEQDARRAVLPSSPKLSMAGLVQHLRWVEHCWFEVMLLGRPTGDNPQFGDDEDADFDVDEDTTLAQLLTAYQDQCAVSDEITSAHGLDDAGRNPDFRAGQATLRWILLHMIEETARHAGHADAIRELIDGSRGYY